MIMADNFVKVCDSLLAEVQTGATVDLTPILPKPDPPQLAKSFSRDAPLPLQDQAEEVLLPSKVESFHSYAAGATWRC